MFAKCVVLLAVVVQINAYGCTQRSPVFSNPGSSSQKYFLVNSGNNVGGSSTGNTITRHIVAKGKFPVALQNGGGNIDKRIPVTTSHITVPLQEKPTVRLPTKIPEQKTISHTCTCYKTIVRPRVHQHIVTVPSVQRFIETRHTPVVENIHYEGFQINNNDNTDSKIILTPVGTSSNLQSVQIPQVLELPQIQTAVQIPQIQNIEFPQLQTIQVPQLQIPQNFELPLGSSCYSKC